MAFFPASQPAGWERMHAGLMLSITTIGMAHGIQECRLPLHPCNCTDRSDSS